ncbi:MAG: ADP-heptose:LPS heptosyltransferase [Alphaproteobacteria bacterium]|jgi:ADP-heptose:LPS heptosyltransferase
MKNILIIKLGALGDFVQATGAFSAIRKHHRDAKITLLTTRAMMSFAYGNPHVDEVLIDERKKPFDLNYLFKLRSMLKGYDMVYDLQTNDRTNYMYFFMAGMPSWCGIAPGCSHKQTHPNRKNMHTIDRLADQIKVAGIDVMDAADLSYASTECESLAKKHNLDLEKTVLLVPGGSKHRPEKRWSYFADLSDIFNEKGYQTILVGAGAEEVLLNDISRHCNAINLCNQTTIGQLICLSSKVAFFVGNDTGPTHIAAASGAKGVVLFGSGSDPQRCAPRAEGVHILCKDDIDAITTQEIIEKIAI